MKGPKKGFFCCLRRKEIRWVALLLLLSLLVRLSLFQFPGYHVDMNTYSAWIGTAVDNGIRNFYDVVWCDYVPFNIYFFWILGYIAKSISLFGTPSVFYLIKLLPSIFDIGTALLIFNFMRKRFDFKTSLIALTAYAFNPATIFNGAVWGQFDAIYTFFLFLSLMLFLESRPKLSVMFFTIALLTKPQSIALAPLIIFLVAKRYGWRGLITSASVAILTTLIVILPFDWSNPISFLYKLYSGGYQGYAYTSINAFNFWALFGLWKPDIQPSLFLNYFALGWALFGLTVAFVLYTLNKKKLGDMHVQFSAFILLFGFFMLLTRIHERYLFPALSLLVLFLAKGKARIIYILLSLAYLINQSYVLYFLDAKAFIPDNDLVVMATSLINLALFFCALAIFWKDKNASLSRRKAVNQM